MKKLLCILLLCPALAWSAGAGIKLDKFPEGRMNDLAALQHGAKLFVNYCLNCHSASAMRYNRLRDIGLTDDQIKQNLLFATDKVGDTMNVAMSAKDAKVWFGAAPPDLSVIARAKSSHAGSGADYLYTFLRTFYVDESRATGWNNLAFPNVGMPHALWELQGLRAAKFADRPDPHDAQKTVHEFAGFEQATPGTLKQDEYDLAVADLVAFINYMSEPAQSTRTKLGVIVLIFLGFFAVIAWFLNASYWKDVK